MERSNGRRPNELIRFGIAFTLFTIFWSHPEFAFGYQQTGANPQASSVPAELFLDDGSFEQGVGASGGGFVAGINRLTPAGYPASLSKLEIFFLPNTGVQIGDSITILVGTNPRGKTTIDGASFQQLNATVGQLGSFILFNVPLTTINSGDFLVGFSMKTANNVFPFAEDQTGFRGRRSYFSTDGVKFRVVDNLGSNIAGNFGIRGEITETLNVDGSTPFVSNLSADLEAGTLVLTGTGSDFRGDMKAADVTLLDENGKSVGDTGQFNVNFGSATATIFSLQVTGLNPLPTAQTASVVIIDQLGTKSAPVSIDFGQADPGAPRVRGVIFKGSKKLLISGGVFSGTLQLEVNGVVVAPPLSIAIISGGSKIRVPGSTSSLNLSKGPNRIRVFAGNFKSDSFVFVD